MISYMKRSRTVNSGRDDEASPTANAGPSIAPGHFDPQQILQALPAAVYATDAAGRITFYNEAASRMWGVRPELGQSEFCGSWKLYWPDGTPLPHAECPMAIALKEKRSVRGMEAIAERPDGVRVPFMALPTPLFDSSGELTGALNMLVDLTEDNSTHEAAERLAAIVEFSDDAILAKDLNGTIVSWNKGAERLFGYTPSEAIGKPVQMLIPPERQDEEPRILDRIKNGDRIDHYETVRCRKDGSMIDISLSVSPIRSRDGRIIGASKIARDITERRLVEQQQRLLLREMDHRVKNLFTLASGVVALSAKSATNPAELATAVNSRLAALAKAHALTIPSPSEGPPTPEQTVSLHALIRTIMAPFEPLHNPTRAHISGRDILVSREAATSLSLLLHEMTTNAAKYGALSVPEGSIDIECKEEGNLVVINWIEQGGPQLQGEPTLAGFGTVLANATARQLRGKITREWRPQGLVVRLEVERGHLIEG